MYNLDDLAEALPEPEIKNLKELPFELREKIAQSFKKTLMQPVNDYKQELTNIQTRAGEMLSNWEDNLDDLRVQDLQENLTQLNIIIKEEQDVKNQYEMMESIIKYKINQQAQVLRKRGDGLFMPPP